MLPTVRPGDSAQARRSTPIAAENYASRRPLVEPARGAGAAGFRTGSTALPACDGRARRRCRARHPLCVAIDEGPPGEDDDRLWGVVSDLDLLRGLSSATGLDAGNLADLETVTVAPEATLASTADAMLRRGVAHLVVVTDGRPVGVLSTLDIARAVRRSRSGDAALTRTGSPRRA